MLRIALTADPYIPVPPPVYGGIERIVGLLVDGLVRRGHEVTLFAHPASTAAATLRPYGARSLTSRMGRARWVADLGWGIWRERSRVDLVHSFGRLAALLPVLPIRSLPKIQSYQRPAVPWKGVHRAVRLGDDSICFTGCSRQMHASAAGDESAGRWVTIFNGVDVARYDAVPSVPGDSPLMFLGRVEPQKGPHHAIAIARRAGRRLVLAGNVEAADAPFFEAEVEPFIDGERVIYAGPVDDVRKNALLGQAAALLMPIECEEAFGIVMAEAMACGTPVIGFRRGSVPEVVRDGENGFVCATIEEAAAAVAKLTTLDRASIRADCERRFSADVIVSQYEDLYHEMIERVGTARPGLSAAEG